MGALELGKAKEGRSQNRKNNDAMQLQRWGCFWLVLSFLIGRSERFEPADEAKRLGWLLLLID